MHPIKVKTSSPYTKPTVVSIPLIKSAITIECSAELSALTLSFDPINLAMDAVTPLPKPNERPITKKKIGILKATAAIASPPNFPIKNISTKE